MAGDKSSYMKVVILLHFISNLMLVRGDGEMDFIRERLLLLETRFSENKALLESRFVENIAILEKKLAEDIALLRRECNQELTTAPEIAENVDVDCTCTKCTNTELRVADCSEWRRLGHTTSGIYTLFPKLMSEPLKVYCDMETDNGGWTVFQRRMDGSEDFYRNWTDYSFGFGNLSGEFWLGNEFVHILTSNASCELRIDMEDFDNDIRVAKYGQFSVGQRSGGFVLSVEDFTGSVDDSFATAHNNRPFSTFDSGPSSKCSKLYKGGWWYDSCHASNLNGLYHAGEHESYADGINWRDWKGHYYSLKKTEMKFRPKYQK